MDARGGPPAIVAIGLAVDAKTNENVIFLIERSRSVLQQRGRQRRFCRLHCASRKDRHGPAMHKLGA
jgi:hypothetical protein